MERMRREVNSSGANQMKHLETEQQRKGCEARQKEREMQMMLGKQERHKQEQRKQQSAAQTKQRKHELHRIIES